MSKPLFERIRLNPNLGDAEEGKGVGSNFTHCWFSLINYKTVKDPTPVFHSGIQ